jgi:hypothetical protein
VTEKMALISALAEQTGRPIDLIDLKAVSEILLGQIVRHGRQSPSRRGRRSSKYERLQTS